MKTRFFLLLALFACCTALAQERPVQSAGQAVPEPDRTIVRMHLEGYEYKEIGARVGMTKNNIGIRLMRIKDKLREQWNTI